MHSFLDFGCCERIDHELMFINKMTVRDCHFLWIHHKILLTILRLRASQLVKVTRSDISF